MDNGVMDEVVKYLDAGLKKGFGIGALKRELIEAGYSRGEINAAVGKVGRSKSKKEVVKKEDEKVVVKKEDMGEKPDGNKVEKKKSVLEDAIKDLEREIGNLSGKKFELKKTLSEVTSEIDVDSEEESKLHAKLAKLSEKETKLTEKKKNLQMKIDGLSEKIAKISKIKSEMTEI
jgi:chromosome segregation ATPase